MIDYRPCGACRELVTASGCEHWRPHGRQVIELVDAAERRRARANARRREAHARDRARVSVEAFRKTMGVGR